METRIYTAGYAGRQAGDLNRIAEALGAVVIDVRLVPQSRWQPQWYRPSLQAQLGGRYLWLPQWGNENYRNGGPVRIADYDAGLKVVTALDFPAQILLCGCKAFGGCHRSHLSHLLRNRGVITEEIDWDSFASGREERN